METSGVGICDYRAFIADEQAARVLIDRLRWGRRMVRRSRTPRWQWGQRAGWGGETGTVKGGRGRLGSPQSVAR